MGLAVRRRPQPGGIAAEELFAVVSPLRGHGLVAVQDAPGPGVNDQDHVHDLVEQGTVAVFAFGQGRLGLAPFVSGKGQGQGEDGQKRQPNEEKNPVEPVLAFGHGEHPALDRIIEAVAQFFQFGERGVAFHGALRTELLLIEKALAQQLLESDDAVTVGAQPVVEVRRLLREHVPAHLRFVQRGEQLVHAVDRLFHEGVHIGEPDRGFAGKIALHGQIALDDVGPGLAQVAAHGRVDHEIFPPGCVGPPQEQAGQRRRRGHGVQMQVDPAAGMLHATALPRHLSHCRLPCGAASGPKPKGRMRS